jgi:hypothetical protein
MKEKNMAKKKKMFTVQHSDVQKKIKYYTRTSQKNKRRKFETEK